MKPELAEARARLVLASRAAGAEGPLDSPWFLAVGFFAAVVEFVVALESTRRIHDATATYSGSPRVLVGRTTKAAAHLDTELVDHWFGPGTDDEGPMPKSKTGERQASGSGGAAPARSGGLLAR